MSFSNNFPTTNPTLELDFANVGALDPRITFTRSSIATVTNSLGLIQTVGANVPRFDYDPVTLAAKGLLIEEQRTNLLTYSEQFDNAAWSKIFCTITANSTTAPDGSTNADTFVESVDSVAQGHYVYQSPTLTASQAYTISCYAKPIASNRLFRLTITDSASTTIALTTFNLTTGTIFSTSVGTASITPVGNGWYRLTATGTVGASGSGLLVFASKSLSNLDYIGDGSSVAFLWGAQLEAGSFATSYIPAVASQVTRSADVASMTGTAFSSWYNQNEGTLYAEFDAFADSGSYFIASISDGTNNNRMQLLPWSSRQGQIVTGGVDQALFDNGTLSINTTTKVAIAYAANNSALSLSGASPATDNTVTVPSVDRLLFGNATSGANPNNGHIRKVAYYPVRLSSTQLQAITS